MQLLGLQLVSMVVSRAFFPLAWVMVILQALCLGVSCIIPSIVRGVRLQFPRRCLGVLQRGVQIYFLQGIDQI